MVPLNGETNKNVESGVISSFNASTSLEILEDKDAGGPSKACPSNVSDPIPFQRL